MLGTPSCPAGPDAADATCSSRPSEDFGAGLLPVEQLGSTPLAGRRLAVIQETSGEGVDAGVSAALAAAVKHLEGLGATVDQVRPATAAVVLFRVFCRCALRSSVSRPPPAAPAPCTITHHLRLPRTARPALIAPARCRCPRLLWACPPTTSLLFLRPPATCHATTACATASAPPPTVRLLVHKPSHRHLRVLGCKGWFCNAGTARVTCLPLHPFECPQSCAACTARHGTRGWAAR